MALQEHRQSPSTQSALANATAGRPDGGKGAPEGSWERKLRKRREDGGMEEKEKSGN